MEKPYFVMLYCRIGATPMTDYDDNVLFFPSLTEARKAVEGNVLADTFGYEVFCLGEGE